MEEDSIKRLEALLAVDDRIKTLESTRHDRRPWWRNATLVAAYGGLIALVPATVTGVAGYLENQRQFELAAQQREHERTLAYLGLAVDPASTEAARAQVLRFLASLEGNPVSAWAQTELARVEDKLTALEETKATMALEVVAAEDKTKLAQTEAAQLQVQARTDPELAQQAAAKTAEAEHLAAELQRKRDGVDAIATRIGEAPIEILQLREAARVTIEDPTLRAAELGPAAGRPFPGRQAP